MELNPPHSGHEKVVAAARKSLGGGAVVAVMSGNFVQRGEPAVFPKHARARAALDIGVDLVLELPTAYALSSSEGFARAGVALLLSTGVVQAIAFGSESGDIDALKKCAAACSSEACEEATREALTRGLSYGAARQSALEALLGGGADIMRSPNNLLGVEYLRAAERLGAAPEFICVRREPGVSATAARGELRGVENTALGVPMFPENLDIAILSRLRAMTADEWGRVRGGGDGLAERAARYCGMGGSVAEVASLIKTRRYAMSRVRRFLLCAAIGIRDDLPETPRYIRVLAANATGCALLREIAEESALPVITKPSASRLLELEAAATDLYNLGYADAAMRAGGAEWKLSPIIID
jgi:predicted nucleotidyltransferase